MSKEDINKIKKNNESNNIEIEKTENVVEEVNADIEQKVEDEKIEGESVIIKDENQETTLLNTNEINQAISKEEGIKIDQTEDDESTEKQIISNRLEKTSENFSENLEEVEDEFFKKKHGKHAIKLIGATFILLAGMGIGTLIHSNSTNTIVKGTNFKVTQQDVMKLAKENSQQTVSNVFISSLEDKLLSTNYSSKVKKSQVEEAFTNYKSQYGDQFSSMLKSQGLSESSFKTQIKTQLMLKEALDDYISKNMMSEKDLEKAWKEYTPQMSVNVESYTTKADAEKAIKNAKANSSSFKSTSVEKQFDSTDLTLTDEFKSEVFKLKKGEVNAKPIEDEDSTTGKKTYSVVYVNSTTEKSKKVNKAKAKEIIKKENQSNSDVLKKMLNKMLKDQNVKLSDSSWKTVYETFTSQLK